MTVSRTRCLAVVSLAAVAVAAPALPALASTSYATGCTLAGGATSQHIAHEAPLSFTGPATSVTVDPQDERLSASSRAALVEGVSPGDNCDVSGEYRDTLTVVAPGVPAGTPVQLTAVVRLVGGLTATGSGALHAAEAEADALFTLARRFAGEGVPDLLHVSASAQADHTQASSTPSVSSLFSHHISVGEELVDSSFERSYTSSVVPFDIGTHTVTIPAAVGDVLDTRARVSTVVAAYDGPSDAQAAVQEFSVELTSATPGVVLDRGDGPAPDPDPTPDPVPTALQHVQAARAALAGYGLPKGITTALGTKLAHAERDITAGADACDDVSAALSQVRAQSGKKLSGGQAAALTALLGAARTQLGC